MAGDLTKRSDAFVDRLLKGWKSLERAHPVEAQLVDEALEGQTSYTRLREYHRGLRKRSEKGR